MLGKYKWLYIHGKITPFILEWLVLCFKKGEMRTKNAVKGLYLLSTAFLLCFRP